MAKLIKTISDFKKSLNGKTVSIHGREYATVSLRLAIIRRNLGASLDIVTKVISCDDKQVIMQADIFIEGKHYIRPFNGRKILYIWEEVEAYLYESAVRNATYIPMASGRVCHG